MCIRDRGESSPYSALSAMAIDPQFISIWMLDDGAELEAMNRDEIEAIRRAPRIDFRRVRDLKMRVLRGCFDRFYEHEWRPGTLKAAALRWFVDREDWWLNDYALYRAIRAREGERPWSEWPEPLRDRDTAAIANSAEELSREMLFRQYIQW